MRMVIHFPFLSVLRYALNARPLGTPVPNILSWPPRLD